MSKFTNLIIDASAGTGKTYTICEKVIERIKAGYSIKDFVIMTYTEKAAGELESRIRNRLKTEKDNDNLTDAEKKYIETGLKEFDFATIGTIHSFCKKVLKEYAFEIGELENLNLENTKSLSNEAYEYNYLLCAVNKNNDKMFEEIAFKENEIKAIGELKKDDVVLPNINDYTKSVLFFDNISKNRELCVLQNYMDSKENFEIYDNKRELLENSNKKYQTIMQERNTIDFNSLISKVAESVEKDFTGINGKKLSSPIENGFVRELQNRWKIGIIDEFQDTSPQQWSIAEGIFLKRYDNGICESLPPHLIIVGDEKQSIYSFQGANVQTYRKAKEDMINKYNAKKDNLNNNYRTDKELIDALNNIFSAEEQVENE